MTYYVVKLHSRSQHSEADVIRRDFDVLASAINFGLPIEGITPLAVSDTYVESVEKVPGDGWSIVMRVRTDRFRHAASVAAVAAQIVDVDSMSVNVR